MAALACTLAVTSVRGAEPDQGKAPATPPAPRSTIPGTPNTNRCRANVDVAPRIGVSINDDQWLFGAGLRSSMPCLGNLGLGPSLSLGVGGNHMTLRSTGHLDYMLWFDDGHMFGVYPAIGASVLFYWPVGPFATFCERVNLDECSGYVFGGEIGGGLRYRMIGIDAFVGFAGLPVLSIMASVSFPVAKQEGQ